ncbi:HAMP domain-containing protein [Cystobacter fuscus]|uniref:ATP-binding protein n=1 Tax=Cystobacter fuscus TaxID=43 RepID=UPI002B31CBCA|nr:HAMP domain-containing protein [Cystobacter fuscus]
MLRLNLHGKLLLAFLLVLIPVLGLLIAGFLLDLRQTRRDLLETQVMTAHSFAMQVADTFDGAIGLGWAVARDPLVRTLEPSVLDAHLKGIVERSPLYEAIAVYDIHGVNRGWGHSQDLAEPRLVIRDRPYFHRVMATNAPLISEVINLRRPRRTGLLVSVPIQGPDKQPIGVVNIVMSSDLLTRRYLDSRLQQRQELFLADAHGRMAFHTGSSHLTWRQSNAFATFAPLQQSLAHVETRVDSFMNPFWGSEEHLGAFVPVPRYPWAVGVSLPTDVAVAPIHERFRSKLLAFSGIVLMSGVLAWVLSSRQVRPVHQLESAARALGRGEMGRRVSIQTGDELEALGSAFNEMADQIVRRAEEVKALHEETGRQAGLLTAILVSVPDAIILASPEGRLVGTNSAGLRLLGLQDASELGIPLDEYLQRYDIRHPDGRPMSRAELPIVRALSGECLDEAEMILRGPDGEPRVLSINGAPVRDGCGRILFGQIVVRDISRHRQEEDKMARLLERELALSRISRALVSEVDLPRLAQVIIEQSHQALGAHAMVLWLAKPDSRRLTLLAAHRIPKEEELDLRELSYDAPWLSTQVARTERGHTLEDLRVQDAPAGTRSLAAKGIVGLSSFPLYAHGGLVGVMTYCTLQPCRLSSLDLEFQNLVGRLFAVALEKARLFQEVRDTLRLREEFMSAAAHEFKTPVTTIQSWSDLLLAKEPLTPRQNKGLAAISRNARRMGRLVEHLFTAVKLAPGVSTLDHTSFDLHELLEEQARAAARNTAHPIHVDSASPLFVHADRRLVGEVVTHLLENALRYSPPGGTVELRSRRQGGETVVSVRDQGPGIPPERQSHVFEPLYEPLPPGAVGYTSVVSLGLHLSRQIIEAHGGQIWLESSPEAGSTFSFCLPLGEASTGAYRSASLPGGTCDRG